MAFVLTEYDIFKHVVLREGDNPGEVKRRTRQLLNRVPINIFENEYYIIYKSLEQADKFQVALSYDHLHHMIINNIDDLIQEDKVSLYSEGDFTTAERADKIIDHCLMEYDELVAADIEDEGSMVANIEYYIDTWGKQKIREIVHAQLDILDEGKRVGNRMYKGVLDSKAYYDTAYTIIRSLMDADAGALSENIDTQVDTVEEIEEKMAAEAESEIVSKTGIAEIDDHYEMHRGEFVTVQAGTGVGKTRFAGNLAYNSVQMGFNVLYVSLEQKSTRIFPMIHARHILEKFGDYPDLHDKALIRKTYSYDKQPIVDEALIDLKSDSELGRIRIEGRSIATDDLYNYMVKVWEEGFHFDVIVIDYIGLLETGRGGRYETLTNSINMLKSECKAFKGGQGFLAIIPNQLTGEAEDKMAQGDMDGMTKLGGSESQYIARASDYIFTLEQPPQMRVMHKMWLHIGKVRLGQIFKNKITTIVDLGKVIFMDDDNDDEDDDY